MSICLALIDNNGIQKTLAADSGDHWAVHVLKALAELLTHCLRTLDHVLLLNQFESTNSNSRTQRVATVCRAVCTRLNRKHDLF